MLKRVFVLLLALLLPACAANAETLRCYYIGSLDPVMDVFLAEHPGVTLTHADSSDYLDTTNEIIGRMAVRDFNWDVFALDNLRGDPQVVMKKGFCLDLTDSEIIRSQHARLWPAIAAQCEANGRIYAVPTALWTAEVLTADKDTFASFGLDASDVPQSFPALLDFLDRWVIHMEESPETISVFNMFDEELYDRNSYPRWLVEMALSQHIWQAQHAGEALCFNDPALLALLNDARLTGQALARIEDSSFQRLPSLFKDEAGGFTQWGDISTWLVPTRLNESQPRLMVMYMNMAAVNAGTMEPELATALLESLVSHPKFAEGTDAMLYTDAQPIERANWPSERAYNDALIAVVENSLAHPEWAFDQCVDVSTLPGPEDDSQRQDKLDSLRYHYANAHDSPDLDELNDRLARWKLWREEEHGRWAFSDQMLADYQQFAPTLFFPKSDAFSVSAGQNLKTLAHRFADGEMDAERLVSELDRLAQMVLLESGGQ